MDQVFHLIFKILRVAVTRDGGSITVLATGRLAQILPEDRKRTKMRWPTNRMPSRNVARLGQVKDTEATFFEKLFKT